MCPICGNHPANYKEYTIYKELQKKHARQFRVKQYTLPAQVGGILHTQPGMLYAQIIKQNSYTSTNIEQGPHKEQFHQQSSDMQDLKML
jgi:hypothetical protein